MVNGNGSDEEVPGPKLKDRVLLGDLTWSRRGMFNSFIKV